MIILIKVDINIQSQRPLLVSPP